MTETREQSLQHKQTNIQTFDDATRNNSNMNTVMMFIANMTAVASRTVVTTVKVKTKKQQRNNYLSLLGGHCRCPSWQIGPSEPTKNDNATKSAVDTAVCSAVATKPAVRRNKKHWLLMTSGQDNSAQEENVNTNANRNPTPTC